MKSVFTSDGPVGDSYSDDASPQGVNVRQELAQQLGADAFGELISAFAEDLRLRFMQADVDGLASDASQVASVADLLGFPELRCAAERLKSIEHSGEDLIDALAHVAIARKGVIRTIAEEVEKGFLGSTRACIAAVAA